MSYLSGIGRFRLPSILLCYTATACLPSQE